MVANGFHLRQTAKIRKIAFVGDHLPRKCGIATFTTDLLSAVQSVYPESQCLCVRCLLNILFCCLTIILLCRALISGQSSDQRSNWRDRTIRPDHSRIERDRAGWFVAASEYRKPPFS